jgi:hypothetical protein
LKTRKVRWYVRVRRPDGRDAFVDPIWNRNRTLRAGYALVRGQPEQHPKACYYLRYLRGGRPVWQSVGSDPDAALAALRNTQHTLEAVSLGRTVKADLSPASAQDTNGSAGCSVAEACKSYLDEIRQFRAPRTVAACENTGEWNVRDAELRGGRMIRLFRSEAPR